MINEARHAVPLIHVALLGHFRITGASVASSALADGSRRLVAYLAIRRRPVARDVVWGSLWPDATDRAASANLRSALWRLHGDGDSIVEASRAEIGLADRVDVDLWDARAIARRLIGGSADLRRTDAASAVVDLLSTDLLPDWFDDWVITEAETWRQLRLHALESYAGRLSELGAHGDAVMAGVAAVHADPLRETGQAALMRAHLAEGNWSEAMRQLEGYRALLRETLGVEPTHRLVSLIAG